MKQAREDRDLRDRYFTQPFRIDKYSSPGDRGYDRGRGRSRSPHRTSSQHDFGSPGGSPGGRKNRNGKPNRKGSKNKDKGKGKGKGGSSVVDAVPYEDKLHSQTPEGKNICKKWNHPRARCEYGAGCRYLHVCQICFGKHQASQCDKRNN